ncbi:MAG: glycoside hydrolase family 3 protein [bacterium]
MHAWVEATLARMSLAEQVGQMLIADFPAVFTHREHENWRRIRSLIQEQRIGGINLAGGSIFEIACLTNELQQLSPVPLLVNADVETGAGFGNPWRRACGRSPELPDCLTGSGTVLPRFMAIGATRNPEYAFQAGQTVGQECRAIGIHWINSPMVDVNTHARNPIVNVRAFADDAELVARMGAAFVKGCQAAGVMATLKHFPGHGDTAEDTHAQLPHLPFDRDRLRRLELIPFQAGISAGAKVVMTAHLALPQIDPSQMPATLSRPLLTDLLRHELGFNGLIMTDALTMQAITDHYDPGEATLLAARAGADLLLLPADMARAHARLVEAVTGNELPAAQVRESVVRILTAKAELGLHSDRIVALDRIREVVNRPEAQRLAERVAEDAITLLDHDGRVLPLRHVQSAKVLALIISSHSDSAEGEYFAEVLMGGDPQLEWLRWNDGEAADILERVRRRLPVCDLVLLAMYLTVGAWKGPMRLPEAMPQLLRHISAHQLPVVAISFGDPYVFADLPKMSASLCAYGSGRLMEGAVARALRGESTIQGKLPVTISARHRFGAGLRFRR